MVQKYLLPTLAILGALLGLLVVFWTQREVPTPPILFPPPVPPYEHYIAGAGIIETSSQNRAVGTPFDEIVTKLFVVEGDHVKAGDPLFQLDLRAFEAQAEAARANVKAAVLLLEDKEKQYSFYKRLKDAKAASEQAFQAAYYAFLEAKENVNVAQANLDVIKANIDRSLIRAPVDGVILQVNIYPGELAPINPFFSNQSTAQAIAQGSLILMGSVNPMQVRIDVDEDDAWRYRKGAAATAFVRGNSLIKFPLTFNRVEPYVIPKSSFTGETTERVDTRVLQVLYNFDKGDLPIYAGQILDIFIEAEPIQPIHSK